MTIKETLETHPAVLLFGVLVLGFGSGIGAVSYLEAREEKLREDIIKELRAENQELSQKNEALNEGYREALAMVDLANAEVQSLSSNTQNEDAVIQELRAENEALKAEVQALSTTYQYASTDIGLIGKAMGSLLTAYVWIERDEDPGRVIPELDNAIDALNKSEAVTSITSLTSARNLYPRAPKGEVQRTLDDAISQIEDQISK